MGKRETFVTKLLGPAVFAGVSSYIESYTTITKICDKNLRKKRCLSPKDFPKFQNWL
jgi:hypothetical protein